MKQLCNNARQLQQAKAPKLGHCQETYDDAVIGSVYISGNEVFYCGECRNLMQRIIQIEVIFKKESK